MNSPRRRALLRPRNKEGRLAKKPLVGQHIWVEQSATFSAESGSLHLLRPARLIRFKRFQLVPLGNPRELPAVLCSLEQTSALEVIQIVTRSLLRNRVVVHVGFSSVVVRRISSRRLQQSHLSMVEPTWTTYDQGAGMIQL